MVAMHRGGGGGGGAARSGDEQHGDYFNCIFEHVRYVILPCG